jgi:hypothetical protein
MALLKGKRILMFSPFGGTGEHYTNSIVRELHKRGAVVNLYDERPSQAAIVKIYMRMFRHLVPSYFSNYIKTIVAKNSKFDPDIVFVVRGEGFDAPILAYLRESFKYAKFILYQWDPLFGKKIGSVLKKYDYSFSIDPNDVRCNPEFKLRPSMFLPEYEAIANLRNELLYDISFVGRLYNNRWRVISRFQDYFLNSGMKYSIYLYFYMPSLTLYLYDFIFKGLFVSPRRMHFRTMPYMENVNVVKNSRCVLDIVYPRQTGLSMRAFEAMAAKRKYITNNQDVKNYDFYNPNNILVVDVNNPIFPKEFINSPFDPVDKSIMYKYSVSGLVDDIFNAI